MKVYILTLASDTTELNNYLSAALQVILRKDFTLPYN